ncbi:hypothetical protein AAHE18_07G046900 [Arachis hypogaea]
MEFGLHSLPRQQLVTHAAVFVLLHISVKCALVCSECRGEDLLGAIMLPSLDLTMVSERHHDDGEAVDMFSQVMMVFLARRVIKHSVHVLG